MTPLVRIEDLRVRFRTAERTVHAVNGVDLSLMPGEVVGLLGESGSGKSVTLKALLRLLPEARTTMSGRMAVAGQDVMALGGSALRAYRGSVVSMIFQEPMLAFDPVFTIGEQIAEAVRRHENADRTAARARALEMLDRVRIPSAKRRLDAYPHEMSGGMRQRAMIALALACRPKLLLADEPTTALDATVQIQILLLLRELQKEFGMGVIFVTHDIGVAVEVSDRLAVMYAGRIVERGSARDLIRAAAHPYPRGLLASTVHGAMRGRRLDAIPGAPPDLAKVPDGCAFAPRCRFADAECVSRRPDIVRIDAGHEAECRRLDAVAASAEG
ncbi:MAG: ATP-binding cassette domain-containing protein [Alphaproteobacteria bacterium]|nr:ATP-binding cassette domain-containing protein [Alphaproteobacteria bacterium]